MPRMSRPHLFFLLSMGWLAACGGPRNAAPGPMGRGLILRPGRVAPIQLATDESSV